MITTSSCKLIQKCLLHNRQIDKYDRLRDRRISTHADPTSTRRANLIGTSWTYQLEIHRPSHAGQFVRFWAQQMGDSLPRTLMNLLATFDAVRSVLSGEIRNRIYKQRKLQTANDISTPCLLACVDKKEHMLTIF